jgi:hypothetical protein
MVSPGDNMAQTEPEDEYEGHPIIGPISGFEAFELMHCVNCDHPRGNHYDRAGCTADNAINLHAAHTAYVRCHCTNFEEVKG